MLFYGRPCDAGYEVMGFGDHKPKLDGDCPDFVISIGGSGVGASVATARAPLQSFLEGQFSGAERHPRR
jgi:hypothetical protein